MAEQQHTSIHKQTTTQLPATEHYLILDGLRGIAALAVLVYHLFEAVAFADGSPEQNFFHGFLAVDFFLLLSGFVMGHAYDSKWDSMSTAQFFKKRLVRLHPMVVFGVLFGLVVFCAQGCLKWDGSQSGTGMVILGTILALLMIPAPLFADLRGNTEAFPLNGPHWSLFFEYIGSIIYAVIIRRISTKALAVLVALALGALAAIGEFGPYGNIAYGWSSEPVNLLGGFLRMMFSYSMGMLLSRLFERSKSAENAKSSAIGGWIFPLCALALLGLLSVPSLGECKLWYELFCVAVAFPAVIWFGARGTIKKSAEGLTRYLGELSYPLYAIHYPLIYLYISWISSGTHPFGEQWWSTPLAIAVASIVLAAAVLKFYDKPVRKRLSRTVSRTICN